MFLTTQASFLAKFKATQNKLGQKRQHHSVLSDVLVVKALDFQSRGPVFKTSGWLQG